MAEFTRTRAFEALAEIFELPGSDSLRLVDISVATPVLDLREIVRSGVATSWVFAAAIDAAAGGTQTLDFDPWVDTFDQVFRGQNPAPPAEVLPAGHDALITGFGVVINADVLTDAWFGLQAVNAAVPLLLHSWWRANQSDRPGDSTERVATNSDGSQYLTPLPWYLEGPEREHMRPYFTARISGAAILSITMRLLSAPRGVLPLS